MAIDTEDGVQSVSKGIYFSKKLCYIVCALIVLSLIGVVLGLVFGLKNAYKSSCNELTEKEKYEACKILSCANQTILQGELINSKLKKYA